MMEWLKRMLGLTPKCEKHKCDFRQPVRHIGPDKINRYWMKCVNDRCRNVRDSYSDGHEKDKNYIEPLPYDYEIDN